MAMLDIRNLELGIYGLPILKNVSLSIAAGETVGLVGESGSGKSMTALATMQLLPRGATATGSIRLDGEELLGRGEREMCTLRGRDIGMVFQEPMTALNPLKTIGAQVSEVFRLHLGASRAECDAWAFQVLERVGLPPSRYSPDRYPHELSGGQRQRVVIAMAVALKPKLVIADEPTTALDVTTQAQILALMRELTAQDGSSLLLITHDLAVVAETADRVVVMRHGEVVEEGETAAFFGGMSHPYSKALFAASTHAPVRVPPKVETGVPILIADAVVREYRTRRPGWFKPAGRYRAVNEVTLSVAPGESVGLVGESGCGKSTLARTLLALEAPQGGRVVFRGGDVASMGAGDIARLRRDIQVVFQDPYGSFDPRHKAGRLVAEPLHLLKGEIDAAERDRRIAQVLTDVGLKPQDAEKYPHEFSGGQRQRLAIARALITRPALIVLDEPVSALDVSIRAQVLDLLADLQARHGLAYLFISHDLAVVRAITDRVLVMKAGVIVEQGPTAAVLDDPQHDYTRALVAASPDLGRALAERRGRAMSSANGRGAGNPVPSA